MARPWMILLAASCALSVLGCGQKEAKWTKEAAQYAVYATQIPLYPGAQVKDAMGSNGYGSSLADHVSEGMTWWFEAECTREELVSWYGERLAGASQEETEDGDLVFTLLPPGGEEGEDMGVIIAGDEPGKFRVFESTKPGKHTD